MNINSKLSQSAANAQAARLVFETFSASGPFHCVLSPGGRNAPLAFALSAYPESYSTVILDERQAGFFALGRALGQPDVLTVLMCTSGSAGAHYLPAIIEADYSGTPLLVVTADRPDRLRNTGAAQTIDQRNFYGHHVLTHAHVNVDGASMQVLNNELCRLIECAKANRGPVHLNIGFDEPLYVNDDSSCLSTKPETVPENPTPLSNSELITLGNFFTESRTGILILGPNAVRSESEALAVRSLMSRIHWTCFVHAASGMPRCAEIGVVEGALDHWITNDGLNIQSHLPVFYLGQAPTSRIVLNFLGSHPHVMSWSRGRHRTQPWANGTAFNGFTAKRMNQLAASLSEPIGTAPASDYLDINQTLAMGKVPEIKDGWSASVFHRLCRQTTSTCQLLVGNSLPIRDLDLFSHRIPRNLRVYANRGVNGIDGHIATACGLASARPDMKTVLVCGDLTALHDISALSLALNTTLTVIVLDNGGGGIFNQLPFAEPSSRFSRFFTTPQSTNLTAVAAAFGVHACEVETWEESEIDGLISEERPMMVVFKVDEENASVSRAHMLRKIAECFEAEI